MAFPEEEIYKTQSLRICIKQRLIATYGAESWTVANKMESLTNGKERTEKNIQTY